MIYLLFIGIEHYYQYALISLYLIVKDINIIVGSVPSRVEKLRTTLLVGWRGCSINLLSWLEGLLHHIGGGRDWKFSMKGRQSLRKALTLSYNN